MQFQINNNMPIVEEQPLTLDFFNLILQEIFSSSGDNSISKACLYTSLSNGSYIKLQSSDEGSNGYALGYVDTELTGEEFNVESSEYNNTIKVSNKSRIEFAMNESEDTNWPDVHAVGLISKNGYLIGFLKFSSPMEVPPRTNLSFDPSGMEFTLGNLYNPNIGS